jgi:N-acetylneuraminic acid mutarotase
MNPPRAARRGVVAAVALNLAALVVIVASVPVAWAWLDDVRPAGLAGPGATGPGSSASAGALPSGTPGPAGSGGQGGASPTPIVGTGTWTATASLPEPVWGSASAVLPDGRVMVAGGTTGTSSNLATNKVSLFDPNTEQWTSGTPMLVPRAYAMSVILRDGSVLVAGGSLNGQPLDTAERYLPGNDAWVAAGRMNVSRTFGTATLLDDDRVLVAGGGNTGSPGFNATAAAEIYDPEMGTWTATGPLVVARTLHTASLLSDKTVLVAGGAAHYSGTAGAVAWTTEIYDPSLETWHKTGKMATTRYFHAAVNLTESRVLVAGGWARTSDTDPSQATTEIYDLNTGQWSVTGSMSVGRAKLRLASLPDGRVLAAGGVDPAYKVLGSSEIYDPLTREWQSSGDLTIAVLWPVLATLQDGRVLIAGGATDTRARHLTSACALYAPPPR